jgi:hypothetical protein
MADESRQIADDFQDNVNMTRKELEDWLQTDESKSVGQGDGESKRHESGRRIVGLLEKNKSDYTDADVGHMKKVNSYVKRHMGQGPQGDPEDSKWRYSLMNWGHDPLKD